MLFMRRKPVCAKVLDQKTDVELNVPSGADIERQVKMIGLTEKDLQIIHNLQPFVIEKIDRIVGDFYKNIEKEASLLEIINCNSSIDRLRETLKRHISEMFSGTINENYYMKRIKIAQIHVHIGLKMKWYMCAFQGFLVSLIHLIDEHVIEREERVLAMKAVTKLLNLEQQLVLEAYDSETERIRKQDEEQKSIRDDVVAASNDLATLSIDTTAAFHQLNGQSDEIVSLAHEGTKLSSIAEERAYKGMGQLAEQHKNAEAIGSAIRDTLEDVQVLLDISNRVQEIVQMVTGIADQTNLLSLNAAIEAARAGEAGKGFAIVAEEVRKLSDETKKSVSNVADLLEGTGSQTDKLTMSLEKVQSAVNRNNESVVKTEAYFERILKTMADSKLHNNNIEAELIDFEGVVNALGKSFEVVSQSADHLKRITSEME